MRVVSPRTQPATRSSYGSGPPEEGTTRPSWSLEAMHAALLSRWPSRLRSGYKRAPPLMLHAVPLAAAAGGTPSAT